MSTEDNFTDERVELLRKHVEECSRCGWDNDGDGIFDPHFCNYGEALYDDVPASFDPLAGMYPREDSDNAEG